MMIIFYAFGGESFLKNVPYVIKAHFRIGQVNVESLNTATGIYLTFHIE